MSCIRGNDVDVRVIVEGGNCEGWWSGVESRYGEHLERPTESRLGKWQELEKYSAGECGRNMREGQEKTHGCRL